MSVLIPAGSRAALLAILSCSAASTALAQSPSWTAVDQAIGRSGIPQPGGVQKYSFPRSDLHVTAGGVSLKPTLALGGWVAFMPVGAKDVMAMGDLVLLESEVTPVMSKLQSLGVEQTALHNHLQHETPRVMYMHVQAHGDAVKIAQAVREALAATKTPPVPPSPPAARPFGLDSARLAATLGYSGKVTGGVYQVSVPRAGPVKMNGQDLPPAMGVATALNFQPTGGGKAAITGDFVLTADEVNPVIRALREGRVEVTALHSHMLGEEPRLYFMHFWANADALALARTLHAALGRMKVKPAGA
jgi:hypothetical protein